LRGHPLLRLSLAARLDRLRVFHLSATREGGKSERRRLFSARHRRIPAADAIEHAVRDIQRAQHGIRVPYRLYDDRDAFLDLVDLTIVNEVLLRVYSEHGLLLAVLKGYGHAGPGHLRQPAIDARLLQKAVQGLAAVVAFGDDVFEVLVRGTQFTDLAAVLLDF